MKKNVKIIGFQADEEHIKKMQELQEAQDIENVSLFIRRLIRSAWTEMFGSDKEKSGKPGSANK